MMKNILLFLYVGLLSVSISAQQKAVANDRWDDQFILSNAPDDIVRAIESDDNYIYAGGDFLNVAGQSIPYLAKYDGTSWTAFGAGINGVVYDILIDGSEIYVGGSFTSIGGISANNIAMWDGTNWYALGLGITGTVYCLEKNDNYLFAGGSITNAGGMPVNNIAEWDGTSWYPLGLGTDNTVYSLATTGTQIYAGGSFTVAGGNANTSHISVWNGMTWANLGDGLDGNVYSIYEDSGTLYVGGEFLNSGTISLTRIAKWYSGSWFPVGSGADGTIYSICEFNGNVYFAGNYTSIDGVSAPNISYYNSVSFSALGSGINGPVYELFPLSFELLAGGDFTSAGGKNSSYIARWMSPPLIVTQPADANSCLTDTVTFFVDADGTPPFTYQWKFNGSDLVGATDSFYTIYGVIPPDAGIYKCVIMNASDTVASNNANLVVHQPPVITLDPVNLQKCEGESASFTIIASTTTAMTYQWLHDGLNISGANSASFSIPSVALPDSGQYICIVVNSCGSDTSQTAKLVVHPLPVVYFTGLALNYCTNDQRDTLNPVPSGGVFSGAGMNDSIFNPAGLLGTFVINYTFTDIYGCTADYDKSVTIHGLPVADLTGLESDYCLNDLPDALGGAPAGGVFSGQGMNANVFNPATAGPGTWDITYTYTDNNGCVDNEVLVTVVYDVPYISVGNDTSICMGETLSLNMTGDFGMYGWFFTSDLFTLLDVYPVSDTSYAGWIMNSHGCLSVDSIYVIVNDLPTGVSFSGLESEYCNYEIADTLTGIPAGGVYLNAAVSGDVFYPYLLTDGYYEIIYQYTDSNGCSSYDTNLVYIKPVIESSFTGLDAQYCLNNPSDTLFGSPSGGTFSGGNISVNIFNPQLAGIGIHEIIYQYLDTNSCYSYDTIITEVLDLPDLNLGVDTGICAGDSIVIYANSMTALNYYWSNGSNADSVIVSPLTPTYYTLTVTDNSCINSDSVFVDSYPYPDVDLGADRDLCAGEFLNAGGGNASYTWIPSGTDSLMAVTQSGTYYVTVTSDNGCISMDQVIITLLPTPEVDLGNDIAITEDQIVILGAGGNYNSYLWNTGSTGSLISIDGSLLGYGEFEYWVVASNSNGCFDTDTILIFVGYGLGFSNAQSEDFDVFPVPANDVVYVTSGKDICSVCLFDPTGEKLFFKNVTGKTLSLDISNISQGVYFLEVIGEDWKKVQKVVKE